MGNHECEKVRRLLPDYAVTAGAVRGKRFIEQHLKSCPGCARELRALQRTGELLGGLPSEPAPDQWHAIRPKLAPRQALAGISALTAWLSKYRLQMVAATVLAFLVVVGFLISKPKVTPSDTEFQPYFSSYASMSWREPFADRAALDLAAFTPVDSKRYKR